MVKCANWHYIFACSPVLAMYPTADVMASDSDGQSHEDEWYVWNTV